MFNPLFTWGIAYWLGEAFKENNYTIPYCCNGCKHFRGLTIPCKKGNYPEESGEYCFDEEKWDDLDDDLDDYLDDDLDGDLDDDLDDDI